MLLYDRLKSDIVAALKGGQKEIVPQLRSLNSAILRVSKDKGLEITDELFLDITKKCIKELENARTYAVTAGRADLIDINKKEVALLSAYMPEALSFEETEKAVLDAIAATGASTKKEMGKVMASLKREFGARLNMGLTSRIVGEKLS